MILTYFQHKHVKSKSEFDYIGFFTNQKLSVYYTCTLSLRRSQCHNVSYKKKKHSQFGCVLGFILCTKQLLCNDMSFYSAGFVQKYHTIAITIDNAYMYSQITDLITCSGIKWMYTSKMSFNKTVANYPFNVFWF